MRECRQRNVGGKARLSETWKHLSSGNTVMVLVWSYWGAVGLADVSAPAEASSLVSPAILPTQAQLIYLPLQPSYSLFTFNESHDLTTNPTQELRSGTASALLVSHLESWCLRSTQGKVLVALRDASGQLQITQWYWIKQFIILLKGPCWHPCLLYSGSVLLERRYKLLISLLYMRKKAPLFRRKNKGCFVRFLLCIIRGMICFVLSNLESLALIYTVTSMNERKPVSALTP